MRPDGPAPAVDATDPAATGRNRVCPCGVANGAHSAILPHDTRVAHWSPRRPDHPRTLPHDTGVATVLSCVVAAVLLVVTGLVVQFGAVVVARHRAESAADLAALAGARSALAGSAAVCTAAQRVANANGAALDSCEEVEVDVLVVVSVRVRAGPLAGQARGRARAGPDGVAVG